MSAYRADAEQTRKSGAQAIAGLPRLLPGPWPVVQVLDIGAMPEGHNRYQPLIDLGLASVTGFEPQEAQAARLNAVAGPHRYLPYFLGSGGPADFHVTRWPGCSSLFEPDPAVIDLFYGIEASHPDGNFHVVATQTVQTIRLDEVAECPKPDYVKLDTQGSEVAILSSGREKLADAVVVESETMFIPVYRGQPLFGDLQKLMLDMGFLFHKFMDIAGRALAPMTPPNPAAPVSQALWADAVFVRDFVRLERWSAEQLRKAVLILHEMYRSYDLVLYLLRELDRRDGTDLAPAYMSMLRQAGPLPILFMSVKQTP